MARRPGGQFQTGDFGRSCPVKFGNVCRSYSKLAQPCPSSERGDEANARLKLRQRSDCGRSEVVVMVMRNENDVEWRKLIERQSGCVEAFGAHELEGAGTLLPNGVDEHADAV